MRLAIRRVRDKTRWTSLVTCFLALGGCVYADEPTSLLPDPGFRPDSQYAVDFVNSMGTATVAVYPGIVRRSGRTGHSFDAQAETIAMLQQAGFNVVRASRRIDLGRYMAGSQWDLFQSDMQRIGETLKPVRTEAQFHLVLEFLLPASDQRIFGIHCYVLDSQGNNAFSFLLNAHHKPFADAQLVARGSSEAERKAMIARATQTVVKALFAQIDRERGRAARVAAFAATEHEAVVFDDFEKPVGRITGTQGVELGHVTFSDERSVIRVLQTTDYPAMPGASESNHVLQFEMNVRNWAGFAHFFFYQSETSTQWTNYDWRAYDGVRFWFYGQSRKILFFVDVIDNRNPGSTTDDAERFVYTFTDDFEGWRQISIPFGAMVRKDVGNGAPDDGFGLSAVHGWAIGALNTRGEVTYYIDDFALLQPEEPPPDAIPGPVAAEYPINELPMYGLRDKTTEQKQADETYIRTMTAGGRSRDAAAEMVAQGAWNLFYAGDKQTAIRRFNQAWLLDPGNQLALWGFAVTSVDRGLLDEAVHFYRMAIESGPENPRLMKDYELTLRQLQASKEKGSEYISRE